MIALNHSFIASIASTSPARAHAALAFINSIRRRTNSLPRVHPSFVTSHVGEEPFTKWANRLKRAPDRGPLVVLLLSMMSGPFLEGAPFEGSIEPAVDALPPWLDETIRTLLASPPSPGVLVGLVSPAPTGGADAPTYSGGERSISNWFDEAAFERAVIAASKGETTIEVLRKAEHQMGGRLVVLPSAIRSAEAWKLDCASSDLLRALLGLEVYASALLKGLPREQCAAQYRQHCEIEMSQESAEIWRRPPRRRQRLFVAGPHGEQYFDMHAKPGKLTRVHIWVSNDADRKIYVGYCGRHLE